jgi:hypothetical protein
MRGSFGRCCCSLRSLFAAWTSAVAVFFGCICVVWVLFLYPCCWWTVGGGTSFWLRLVLFAFFITVG